MLSMTKAFTILSMILLLVIVLLIATPTIYYTNKTLFTDGWFYGELNYNEFYKDTFGVLSGLSIKNISPKEKYVETTIFKKIFVIRDTKNLFSSHNMEIDKITTWYNFLPKNLDIFKIKFSHENLGEQHEIFVPLLVHLNSRDEWKILKLSTCVLGKCEAVDEIVYGRREFTLPNSIKDDVKEIMIMSPYVVKLVNDTLAQPDMDNVRIYGLEILDVNENVIIKLV